MPHQFTLPPSELAAFLAFASHDPMRPNINGVAFFVADGCAWTYATDGHRLLARRTQIDTDPVARFIVPADLLTSIQPADELLTIESVDGSVHLTCGPWSAIHKPKKISPPDAITVLQYSEEWKSSTSALAFDPGLFAEFGLLSKLIRHWWATIPPDELGPIRLDAAPGEVQWSALVMPCHMDKPEHAPEVGGD